MSILTKTATEVFSPFLPNGKPRPIDANEVKTWGQEIEIAAGVPDLAAIDNSRLANMAQATIKGRASGGGTGAPQDLTATQVKTILGIGDYWPRHNIRNYGALATGSATDATANYNAVVAAIAAHGTAYIPSTSLGFHFGTNTITVDSRQKIEGQNRALVYSTATTSLFRVVSQYGGARISGLNIDMTGSGASSAAIRLDNSVDPVWGVQIHDMDFQNCVCAIDTPGSANFIVEIDVCYIRCRLTRGTQIKIFRSQGFIIFRDVNIDNTFAANIQTNWFDILIEKPAGVFFENVFCSGQSGAWATLNSVTPAFDNDVGGIKVDGNGAPEGYVWFKTARVESSMGHGIFVFDIVYLYGTEAESFAQLGYGFYFSNVTEGMMGAVSSRGPNDLTGGAAGTSGIIFDGCQNIAISILRSVNATSHGVVFANTTGMVIGSLICRSNSGYGIADSGTAANNVLAYGDLRSNTSGKAALGGAGTIYTAANFL